MNGYLNDQPDRDLAFGPVAANLTKAVRHYEVALGFAYTDQEREDLAAFLEAL